MTFHDLRILASRASTGNVYAMKELPYAVEGYAIEHHDLARENEKLAKKLRDVIGERDAARNLIEEMRELQREMARKPRNEA